MKQKHKTKRPPSAISFKILFASAFLTVIFCLLTCAVLVADYNMRRDAFPDARSVFLILPQENGELSVQVMGQSYSLPQNLLKETLRIRAKTDFLFGPAVRFAEGALYRLAQIILREF